MHTSTGPRNWLPHAVIIACASVVLGWQLMFPGYYSVPLDDVANTHKYITQFTESFRQGILYPRWMAECFGGYGSPVFVYYSPALYYLAGLAGLAGISPSLSIATLQLLSLCIGGVSVYYLVRRGFGQRAALVSAILYLAIPTRLIFLYYINSYAGRFAEGLMPLTLLLTAKLVDGSFRRKYLAGFALSYAALILSHIATAYIFTPFIIAFALFNSNIPSSKVWPRLALGLLAGMGVASFLFVPVLFERGYVHLEILKSFLSNTSFMFNLTGSPAQTQGDKLQQFYPASLVAETVIAAALSYLAWRKAGLAMTRQTIFFLASAGVCLFMMSSLSIPLWRILPGLTSVALPFRFAAIFMVFVPAVMGIAIDRLIAARLPLFIALSAAVLALALVSFDVKLVREASRPYTEAEAVSLGLKQDMIEYLPSTSSFKSLNRLGADKPKPVEGKGIAEIKKWGYADREFSFESNEGQTLRIKTFMFPGWRGFLDGRELKLYPEEGTGAILMDVPYGRHDVTLKFCDTLPRQAGKIISIMALVLLVLPYKRRRPSGPGISA